MLTHRYRPEQVYLALEMCWLSPDILYSQPQGQGSSQDFSFINRRYFHELGYSCTQDILQRGPFTGSRFWRFTADRIFLFHNPNSTEVIAVIIVVGGEVLE